MGKTAVEKIIRYLGGKSSTLAEITMETRSRTNEIKNILYLLRQLGVIKATYDEARQKHYFSVVYPVPDNLEKIVLTTEAIFSVIETRGEEIYEENFRNLVLQKSAVEKGAYKASLELLQKAGTISIYNCPSATEIKRVIKITNPLMVVTHKTPQPTNSE